MNALFLFVCPAGSGGTYWTDYFTEQYPRLFTRVNTWTTRLPRNDADHLDYHFMSESEFLAMKEKGDFFETDTDSAGHFKGSREKDFTESLVQKNAIKKITASGAMTIIRRSFVPACIVLIENDRELLEYTLAQRLKLSREISKGETLDGLAKKAKREMELALQEKKAAEDILDSAGVRYTSICLSINESRNKEIWRVYFLTQGISLE